MQHPEFQELIPLYAIDALTRQETVQVERHLADCAACRVLLSEYRLVADEMLEQVPVKTAPARIGVWLENQTRSDVRRAPAITSRAIKSAPRPFWRQTVTLPRWGVAFAGGVAVLLVVLGALVLFQLTRGAPSSTAELARLIAAPDRKTVQLVGTERAPTARGQLVFASDSNVCLLLVNDMPPLTADRAYQIWLLSKGDRETGGVFQVDQQGRAVIVFTAPDRLGDYQEIGITVEPARGSPGPTTPRVIGGKLD